MRHSLLATSLVPTEFSDLLRPPSAATAALLVLAAGARSHNLPDQRNWDLNGPKSPG